jgi:hypothetical protein
MYKTGGASGVKQCCPVALYAALIQLEFAADISQHQGAKVRIEVSISAAVCIPRCCEYAAHQSSEQQTLYAWLYMYTTSGGASGVKQCCPAALHAALNHIESAADISQHQGAKMRVDVSINAAVCLQRCCMYTAHCTKNNKPHLYTCTCMNPSVVHQVSNDAAQL